MGRAPVSTQPSGVAVGAGGILAAIVVAAALVPLRDTFGNTNLALVLVVVIVGAASIGGRTAGAMTSLGAALAFNFFQTQPYLTLAIDDSDDVATVVLLFVVGLVVGELASLRLRSRREARVQSEGAHVLERVAAATAANEGAERVWPLVRDGLISELDLADARFEPVPFSGRLAELQHNGRVGGPSEWAPGGFVLPADGVELEVEHDGRLLGRLVLMPRARTATSIDQRRVAVALADQLAVVLSRARPVAPLH
jgi:hypothetical protein